MPPDAPPGWTTKPSAWRERLPIIGLALIGTAIAGYLSLYQLEVNLHRVGALLRGR